MSVRLGVDSPQHIKTRSAATLKQKRKSNIINVLVRVLVMVLLLMGGLWGEFLWGANLTWEKGTPLTLFLGGMLFITASRHKRDS